jgi:pathogenesis-related protein 1
MFKVAMYGLAVLMLSGCGGGTTNGGSTGNGTTDDTIVAKSINDVNVTSADIANIPARHNYYRGLVTGASIPDLIWDDNLAMHAQTWANYLAAHYSNDDATNGVSPHAKHYQTDNHNEDDHNEGENIANSTKHIGYVDTINGPIDTTLEYVVNATGAQQELLDVNGAIDAWATEAYYYDYSTNSTNTLGKPVGHYTQIIWKNTTKVGCGKAISKKYKFFDGNQDVYYEWVVCRYSPPGNVAGEKPY